MRCLARESNVRGFKLYTLGGGVFTIVPVPGAELLTQPTFSIAAGQGQRFWVVTIDALGQEGQPSSSAVFASIYRGFFTGPWHQ